MTTSVYSKTSTQAAIQINGVDAVIIDPTGITTGAGRRLAQVVTFQTGTVATGTTLIPFDNTIPQNTEGNEFMSLAITPTNALSTLEVFVEAITSHSVGLAVINLSLFRDAVANADAAVIASSPGAAAMAPPLILNYLMTAGTTSAITFKVRIGANQAGTTTFNGSLGTAYVGGVLASRITIKEYLP